MKYFKVFNTESEYNAYIHSEDCITPYVITLRDSSNTWISAEIHDYSKDYFTIESLEDDNLIKFGRSTGGGNISELHIAASTDDGATWTEYTLPFENGQYEITTINTGEKIIFKYLSGGFSRALGTSTYFTTSGNFNVYGNAMSLVKAGDFTTGTTSFNLNRLLYGSKVVSAENLILPPRFSDNDDLFADMFSGCTNLTTPPLVLPETTLDNRSYYNMFKGCTSLETVPVMSATTLANECCRGMFDGCTSLTTVPNDYLPATTLSSACYRAMFANCSNLESAPELPATTVGVNSCESMFEGCTSLTTPPSELLATTMASNCYYKMFSKCTSLTTTPSFTVSTAASGCCWEMFGDCTSLTAIPLSLSATTLEDDCYRSMFVRCTSLTVAPELPATTLAENCYRYMFMDDTALTTSPSELPATTLAINSYNCMFSGCTALTAAPEISATTLAISSCQEMFEGCTSLEEAPEFHFTTVADSCCYRMFSGCTSLTAVTSELPATTLANKCYNDMFCDCAALTAAPEICATTVANECCRGMFYKCTSLTTAPSVLPATTLADGCYRLMFEDCTSLTATPSLPANTLAANCYREMFNGCTSLITAPSILSATTLADSCYREMFRWCAALTTAPEISATTVSNYSCGWMFSGCSGLTTAPSVLPATTLADGCYHSMFGDCKSLTVAPELPATTLVYRCYCHMFDNSNISYIKCLATDISATECTEQWLYRVPNVSGRTFVKNSIMSDWTRTASGIPSNWNVRDDTYVTVTGVTLNTGSTTVNKGNTYTLTATVLPVNADDQAVTWSTSDSSVATVVGGVVTGVGCGNATITVTTHELSYTAQCVVTVENHVTAVDLNAYIVTIISGGTYKLEATVSPSDACDKSVTWTSSDDTIATVDSNGLVSGVTTGDAVVTVTSNDTNSATCNCSVTVNEGQHATGVTLSDASISLDVNSTYTLTATVLPNDAINKSVTWTTSNATIATVDSNGVVSGVASGDATITVTTVDGGFTAQCSVSVSEEHDYSKDYFTIESLENNNAITFVITSTTTGNLGYYSTDNGTTWTQIESGNGAKTIATLNSGDTVLIKATSQTSGQQAKWATDYNKNSYFNATKTYKIYGNAMSLLTGDDFETATTITQTFALCGLFFGGNNSTKLLDASNLVLPATGLTQSSYNGMFRGCKALQHGPKLLPALVVPQDGYSSMFESGTSLVEAPEIMATTVSGNTALNRMFCMARSGAVTAAMTKGPVLRVTNPNAYTNTYQQLFAGNGNITEVTMLAKGTNLSFANWLANVPAVGVIKKLSTTTLTSGASGIPTGWTVVDYTE